MTRRLLLIAVLLFGALACSGGDGEGPHGMGDEDEAAEPTDPRTLIEMAPAAIDRWWRRAPLV